MSQVLSISSWRLQPSCLSYLQTTVGKRLEDLKLATLCRSSSLKWTGTICNAGYDGHSLQTRERKSSEQLEWFSCIFISKQVLIKSQCLYHQGQRKIYRMLQLKMGILFKPWAYIKFEIEILNKHYLNAVKEYWSLFILTIFRATLIGYRLYSSTWRLKPT